MPTTSKKLAHMPDSELIALAEKANGSVTVEQRAQIHLDARMESRTVLNRYRRNALIGFAILLAGIAGVRYEDTQGLNAHREAVVKSGNAVAVKSCNRDFRNSLKQRVALERVQTRDEDGPVISPAEQKRQIEQLTPLPDCRGSVRITDEPGEEIAMPEPLHENLLKDNKLKKRLAEAPGIE